ncbi:hypothetical protein [Methylobacterium bullatum]|uniref:Uncharacterized protein n=1 Tax=Methylobacterium bullatum TaxID=570505 RepID=A0A679KIG3_9HYPH|nr:hypothetical protein MBLL_04722 [Methylobacterium bullatum]
MMVAPRFDRKALIDRIHATQVQMDAVGAEHRRLVRQLARLPDDAPDAAVAAPRRGVEIGIAARRVGRSVDTLIRRGKPLGWAWKVGGRWEVDLAAVDAWKAGLAAQS